MMLLWHNEAPFDCWQMPVTDHPRRTPATELACNRSKGRLTRQRAV
jgi:hypothetical protein